MTSDTSAVPGEAGTKARQTVGRATIQNMSTGRLGDRLFAGVSRGSGIVILLIMAAIAAFLVIKAIPALQADKVNFLTAQEWSPDSAPPRFGIAQLTFGTLMTSLLALLMAMPVAVGIALFITFYSSRRLAGALGYVVDLLAAVPSIVYGLWGLNFLVTKMTGASQFLNDYFGWIPLFGGDNVGGHTILTASIVLAIMILPIISAITREVFIQVPHANVEAAMALGATQWEVIRMAVLPFGRSGMISAAMLGLGRAIGETIAVAMVLSTTRTINWHILEDGGNTFAANIANTFEMSGAAGRNALIASGLVLFVITMLVNMGARAIVARRKEFV